jgi:serine/threonine/tyrosine-interacting protein
MEVMGWSYDTAYTYVQNRRFCINPNEAFKHQLRNYEAIAKARLSVSPLEAQNASPRLSNKREWDNDMEEEGSGRLLPEVSSGSNGNGKRPLMSS